MPSETKMQFILIICIAIGLWSCEKKKEKSSEPEGAQTPQVPISADQPVIPDPSSGNANVPVDNDDEDDTETPEPEFSDFRSDAKITYSLPTTFLSIDPRSFVPTGNYQQGSTSLVLDFSKSNILVPHDGWMREHSQCKYPIRAPGHENFTVSVDGNANEWPLGSIIAIDRAGDGANGSSTADVRTVRWTSNSNHYFITFEMAANWPNNALIRLDFAKLLLPADNTTSPNTSTNQADRLWTLIGNNRLYIYDDSITTYSQQTSGSGVGQLDFALATSGNTVELKLPRTAIDPLMDGQPFVVTMNTEFSGNPDIDNVGTHIVGLTDDYACLVPLPNSNGAMDSYKMVVMRRTPGVSASDAENVYRAMIAAMPETTMNTKDNYDMVDTFSLTTISAMKPAGVCGLRIGIIMEDDIHDRFGIKRQPYMNFYVAAHEYLHNFNSQDYVLPASWGVEGHSEWMSFKTMTGYYGKWAGQTKFNRSVRSFREEEETNSTVKTIAQATWGSSPFSALFYYDKSSTYWDILSTKVEYNDLLTNFFRKAQTSTAYADSNAMIAGLKGLSSYTLEADDDIESGWFGGNYSSSVIPLTLTDDNDGDGLLNYHETALGTNLNNSDTDNDGFSDTFEWAVGLDPKVSAVQNQLAFDQSLSDWEQNAQDKLKTAVVNMASCSTQLKRYGLVTSQGWLFFAGELTANTNSDEVALLLFDVYEPGKPAIQMFVAAGADYMRPAYIDGSEPNKFRPLDLGIAKFGGTEYEVAYNMSWLGWEKIPTGTKVNVRMLVYNIPGDSYTNCDRVDDIQISEY
jgi:hypothetical protein